MAITDEPPQKKARPLTLVWIYLALFVIAYALFAPSLDGQMIWDDEGIMDGGFIGGGTWIGAITRPFISYFRPLTSLSFMLDRSLHGTDIFYYHLTNILLHAIACCLVGWIGVLLTKKPLVGLIAGVAFCFQPSQVGVAAWVGGRTDALSCVFVCLYLGFLILYCHRGQAGFLALSLAAMLLAALSKEQNLAMVLGTPMALVWIAKKPTREAFKLSSPLILMTVLYVGLWLVRKPAGHNVTIPAVEEFVSRVVLSATNYFFVFTGFATKPLFTFSLENYRNPLGYGIGAAVIVGAIAGLVLCTRKGGTVALIAWLLALAYFPVSNLVPVPALLIAPYRIGVASIFFALMLGYLTAKHNRVAIATVTVLLVTTVYQTYRTIPIWKVSFDFSQTVYESDPHSFLAANTYASELIRKERRPEARKVAEALLDWLFDGDSWKQLDKTGSLDPNSLAVTLLGRNAGTNQPPGALLAVLLFTRSQTLEDSAEAFHTLRMAERMNPDDPEVLAALGDHLLVTDRDQAVRYYERSVEKDPHNWQNLWRLAKQRAADRRFGDAEKLFLSALGHAPLASTMWLDYSKMLESQGRYQEAIDAIENSKRGYVFNEDELNKAAARLHQKLAANR